MFQSTTLNRFQTHFEKKIIEYTLNFKSPISTDLLHFRHYSLFYFPLKNTTLVSIPKKILNLMSH